jgi:hypothetical protein
MINSLQCPKLRRAHSLILEMSAPGPVEIRQVLALAREHGISGTTVRRARALMVFIKTLHVNWKDGPGRWYLDPAASLSVAKMAPPLRGKPLRACAWCGKLMLEARSRRRVHPACKRPYRAKLDAARYWRARRA